MKKTLIAASIAALSAGFVAAPAFAEVTGHVGATLGQPTDSDQDTNLNLEAGVEYSHESGAYAGLLFTTYDLLDSDAEFDTGSTIELNLGYAHAIDEALTLDAGFTFTTPIDGDETTEIYFGAGYDVNADLNVSAYYNMILSYEGNSDFDLSYLTFRGDYTALEAVDLFAELNMGLQDLDVYKTLEIGVGKEIMPQNYVTAAFIADLEESDDSYLEFTYTYSF